MRTTITLDDDVAAKLHARAQESGQPFKAVVNEALRAGLAFADRAAAQPPFRIDPAHLFRSRPGINFDKVEDLFDELDGPDRIR